MYKFNLPYYKKDKYFKYLKNYSLTYKKNNNGEYEIIDSTDNCITGRPEYTLFFNKNKIRYCINKFKFVNIYTHTLYGMKVKSFSDFNNRIRISYYIKAPRGKYFVIRDSRKDSKFGYELVQISVLDIDTNYGRNYLNNKYEVLDVSLSMFPLILSVIRNYFNKG